MSVFYRHVKTISTVLILAVLAACGGGGAKGPETNTGGGTTPPPSTGASVASLQLSASQPKVKSDGTDKSTITVTALDAGNAVIKGATVIFTASTGILVPGTVVTDDNGSAKVEFSSGTSDAATRTASITASASGKTSQVPIQIIGTTVSITATATTIPDNGSSTSVLTAQVKNAGGGPVSAVAVSFTQTSADGGAVSLSVAGGTTDTAGQTSVIVRGTAPGTVTVAASALGETQKQVFSVTSTGSAFSIDSQTSSTRGSLPNSDVTGINTVDLLNNGEKLTITVNAPSASSVIFATSLGKWNNSQSVVTVPVIAGKASAELSSSKAGVASLQVTDPSNSASTDTLSVAITAPGSAAKKVTIQASPTTIPTSTGGATGLSTLFAKVTDASDNPVGNVAVAFEILNPTGGGETISPVVQFTAATPTAGLSLGQAKATLTSGSLPSGATGVKIRVRVVDGSNPAAIATHQVINTGDPAPACAVCGLDAAIVIGGTAGSIALSQPSEFSEDDSKSQYIFPMSVFVADANGNGVAGATVSLSAWPIAFNTGGPCSFESDLLVTKDANGNIVSTADNATGGTFFNEDKNENLILDAGEDGVRKRYFPLTAPAVDHTDGTTDSKITPPNSAAGVLPPPVTTNSNGLATFTLIYPKSSAIHVIDRIRASAIVQGTETVGELQFALPALKKDADANTCFLPTSPYVF
jgi:hypothetical protein